MENYAKRVPKWGPKSIKNSPPGRVRPTAGACWDSVTVCVFPSRMHPFPAVGLVFAVFFFFLGGFHPGSLPFPPLSVVFWPPFGNISRTFGWNWVVNFSVCFSDLFFDDFWYVFCSFLGWFLHVFRILVRTVFLLTFSSDVFQMYAHFQNTGSSKHTVFLE